MSSSTVSLSGALDMVGLGELRENQRLLLVLPLAALEFLFFLIPIALLVRMSLYRPTTQSVYEAGTLSLASYREILANPLIHETIAFTLFFTVLVTAITIVLSTFYAYVLWRATGWLKQVLLVSVILVLMTTLVVRLFALILIFSPSGPTNQLLMALDIVQEPVRMVKNLFGATAGQVYTIFPYSVLAIYSVMTTIDEDILEAAWVHGASRLQAFYEVVLPEAKPGIAVGAVISLAWTFGAYAAPDLLGGTSEHTLAIEIYDLMLTDFNWPVAAALGVLILASVVLSALLLFKFLGIGGGDIEYV
ncbi:spermidine/putrescine ABC transporter permease component potB [Halodesulfurarchaeum formicicum]|uniref:Spermidine/putrescine ABC transporter permease component potB n=1 Tax=Halodesulfurarchaeum formicicum TaxID=1873524 RepID=A0A1D8S224_9EURY|nr:ABC transporter permease [Halodesulfurarchaeum formicicum]AOW79414.1 spermidine/putrescine ABC transporter permease component potB [Halodesulfurarchaeum formicicum]